MTSLAAILGTVVPGAMAQPASEEPDFSVWWLVVAAFVIAPAIMYAVKFFAERRRDRLTRELIADSNKDGAVPELPKDFEVPQVIPRKSKGGRRRFS